MADEFGFRILDGRQSIERIHRDLQRHVTSFLEAPEQVSEEVEA
jgi:hypothetical protein